VLVTDTKGVIKDIVALEEAGDDVEMFEGILTPGLINAHCHLELSHLFQQIPKQTGLVKFVTDIIQHRAAAIETIEAAIEQADVAMYQNGIVAVGDICNTAHTLAQKKRSSLYYHNFIEVSGFPPFVADKRFEEGKSVYKQFAQSFHHNSIVPHAPYSVSTELFDKIAAFSPNRLVTMHNQESEAENILFENKTGDFLKLYESLGINISFFEAMGKSSLEYVRTHFNKTVSTILVHNTHTHETDLINTNQYFDRDALYYCLCPNANWYISNEMPPVKLLMRHECNMVLGTDSLASNDSLSIASEINTLQRQFPALSIEQMLQWATINGAKALGIADQFGSFEKNKKPGLVLLHEERATRLL